MSYRVSTTVFFASAPLLLAAFGCGSSVSVTEPDGSAAGGGDHAAGSGGLGGAAGAGGLHQYGMAPAHWCSPHYDDTTTEILEECCQVMACGPRVDGLCPDPSDVEAESLSGYPPGPNGGMCACADLLGPFAGESWAPPSEECCYATAEIPCSG